MLELLLAAAMSQPVPTTETRMPPRTETPRREPGADPNTIDWARRPTAEEMSRFYPSGAASRGQSGRTLMRCGVLPDGALDRCVILGEAPAEQGFGAATLSAARYFRMTPPLNPDEEQPTVTIPVSWLIEGGRPRASYTSGMSMTPAFRRAPDRAAVAAARPVGLTGETVLSCRARSSGELYECEALAAFEGAVEVETAALALAPAFELRPTTSPRGRLNTLRVTVPIRFTDEPEYLTRPRWERAPSGQDVQAALQPLAAVREDRTALASVDCVVGSGGGLSDCRVLSENAPGVGAAVAALATAFAVRLWTDEGAATVGARVRLPMRYVDD